MQLTRIARTLSLATLVALPAVASADEMVAMLRLTSTGNIVNSIGTIVHTDANIRFIHAARHTLYKVLKDGSIYGARFCRSSLSSGWTYLGKDAGLTSSRQLTGGDNAFLGACTFAPYASNLDGFYNAPLYRLSGGSISRWSGSGTSWSFAASGIAMSGSYKTTGNAAWQGFGPNASTGVFNPAGQLIIQLTHRGGSVNVDNAFYTVNAGAQLVTIKRNSTVLLNLNKGFYVDSMSSHGRVAAFAVAFDDPELGHPDEIKQVSLFKGDVRGTLFSGFVKDVKVGDGDDHGPEVYSLMDDGVGTVKRHYCGVFPCSTATIGAPAGKVVTQIVVVQTTYQP